MAEALLAASQLSRRFGALAAVDGVSLEFEDGVAHAIIGPNGAGKSTLLNLLSGELRATSGSMQFRGRDVTRAAPEALSQMGMGRTYQAANIFRNLSCLDCVRLAAQSRSGNVDDRMKSALRLCGLAPRAAVRAAHLSYGEQRHLELAMVLATDPSLLLLDEPLAGLGHGEALAILQLLQSLARERTLVLVEHDVDAVFRIAQKITVMVDGRVLETGAPEQIRRSPAVRDAYLGVES